jgi:hypothetical protein
LLIITTSKVSSPVAVDMVILARAWFSGSVTNLRWIPGFGFKLRGELDGVGHLRVRDHGDGDDVAAGTQ